MADAANAGGHSPGCPPPPTYPLVAPERFRVSILILLACAAVARLPHAPWRVLIAAPLVVLQLVLALQGQRTPVHAALHALTAVVVFALVWAAARVAPLTVRGPTERRHHPEGRISPECAGNGPTAGRISTLKSQRGE